MVYTSNGHTIELALTQGTTWVKTDLTARLQAPAGYHPRGIVRPDGVTSVIQTDDDADNVREFSLKAG